MAILRYVVPALAVVGHAAAASCSAATTTIQSSGDATALASCRTFSGSIALATGTTGNIALDGIETITGSLIANNATGLNSLSSVSLSSIGDSFMLTGLTGLSTLMFPLLTSVQTVSWTTLTQLQGLSFQSALQQVQSLTISDTQLNSLQGIDLDMAGDISINNNQYLKMIEMQLANVSSALDIYGNYPQLTVSLPNLIWANEMTIRQASAVSIPSLSSVNTTLGFYSNTLQSLSAPNLTSVGGTLAIELNNGLSNASFPELKTIGGSSSGGSLQVQNNTGLSTVNGFPALQRVVGAVNIEGDLKSVALPSINYVRGDFNVESTQDISSSCSNFDSEHGSGSAIQGMYNCGPTTSSSSGGSSSGNGDGTSSAGSGSTSSSAAHPILIPGATGLLGVVAAIFGML